MPKAIYAEADYEGMASCIAEENGEVKRAGGGDCFMLLKALKAKYGKPRELSEGAIMAPFVYVAIWDDETSC